MKNIIGILAVVSFISGCDSNDFLAKIGLTQKITTAIEARNDIAYLPNSDKPFTGKYRIYHSNGRKISEIDYKDGKINGLRSAWPKSILTII